MTTMNYGSVSTIGYRARDHICLYNDVSACVDNFDIFMVTWQSGFPNYAGGIAGLATDSDDKWGPNLIKSFKNAGIIDNAYFCFFLMSSGTDSYIDVGYIRDDAMRDPTNLQMISILSGNYWWAQKVTAIRFGDEDIYEVHGEEAFTDSGTSCIIVPSRYFEWLYDRLRYDYGMSYTS